MRVLDACWGIRTWGRAALTVAASCVVFAAVHTASASDQPDQLLVGSKLIIKHDASDSSKGKLVFLSKDGSFELPNAANDPTQHGAVLRVIDLGLTAGTAAFTLVKERWAATSDGFKYTGQTGDPCKTVSIKHNKLVKAICKGASVTLSPPFAGAAALALEVGTSSIRYCATFGGTIVKNAQKNGKGVFKAKAAPAPPACLSCGDGTLDAGEQCDDGNNQNGDCCSATCRFEASGSGCTDNNPCTLNDQCDGSGTCTGGSTCGNGTVETGCGEQCEVGNDPGCPNRCLSDCTCAPVPTCANRPLFAGGPETGACHQFDDNEILCNQAFLVGDGGVASCYYDPDFDQCNGCGPFNQANGQCVNACNPPTCVGDPSRTAFAGGPESGACENYGLVAGTANCNIAFHIGAGGVASCYYDANFDECRGCGPTNESEGNCVNTCAACMHDPSRTIFAGGPGTQACHQFDGDQASCEQAFHRDQCNHDVSCFFDGFSCNGCGPSNESEGVCKNTCADGPVVCTNDPSRTIDAGGPGTEACHQFDGNPVSCQQAWHHSGCNQAASCYYDFSSDSCSGCGPNNENDGACVNTCVAGPITCPRDPSRTLLAGLPGSSGCRELGQSAGTAACEIAFNVGAGGVASCYLDGSNCLGCGPANEGNGDCRNTCVHGPHTCPDDPSRTIYAGGPGTAACHQFDGDQASCEAAFHTGNCGHEASCYFDGFGSCNGCGPNNEGNNDCVNTCGHPTCNGDATRTIYAGGPGSSGCHVFDGNKTNCQKAYLLGDGGVASCFYDSDTDSCSGCGPNNTQDGLCVNTCAVCAADPSRTIFAGGPFTSPCHQFDGNQASCESAFHYDECGVPTSCFFDGFSCNGCGPNNFANGDCQNTCDVGPPTCEKDASRTIFAGGPNTEACHQFDGNPVSCLKAFHRGNSGIASCFYDGSSGDCSGCGAGNQGSGQCLNTCLHGVPPCSQDPTRTIFAGGPETAACHAFDGNQAGCEDAYHLDQCSNPSSCYYDQGSAQCKGCGPNNQQNGDCVNTCKTGPASCTLDTSRIFFGGGPGTQACTQYDDPASCLAAFHVGQCGVASCFWSGGGCEGCGPNNFFNGECFNTCQAP